MTWNLIFRPEKRFEEHSGSERGWQARQIKKRRRQVREGPTRAKRLERGHGRKVSYGIELYGGDTCKSRPVLRTTRSTMAIEDISRSQKQYGGANTGRGIANRWKSLISRLGLTDLLLGFPRSHLYVDPNGSGSRYTLFGQHDALRHQVDGSITMLITKTRGPEKQQVGIWALASQEI